jgi:putative SOS response-associated peptidase YedK
MCGRFTSLLSPELLSAIFNIYPPPPVVEPRYNIAPTQLVWVVRNDGDHNRLDHMKWGLIPFWAKDQKIGSQLINARSETVHEKPAFRQSIKSRRCIIPVSGFFEWTQVGEQKLPNYIHMADGGVMAFAGIWDQWHLPGEENLLESFSILTTAANELLAPIHDRMPVILTPENFGLWLDKDMHEPEHLRHLYQPFPADQLSMYRVSPLMNSPRHDGADCIARV